MQWTGETLDEPWPHPDIRVIKDVSTRESVGGYDHDNKEVILVNPKRLNEEEVLNILLHELEHWAQEMYLPQTDCIKVCRAAKKIIYTDSGRHQDALIEKINPFKVWLYKKEFMGPEGVKRLYQTDNGPSRYDEAMWKAYWRAATFEE